MAHMASFLHELHWLILFALSRFPPKLQWQVIMSVLVSQITSVSAVYSTFFQASIKKKKKSSASLAFVRGIHRWPVNSPHKGPVTWKMFHKHWLIMPLPGTRWSVSRDIPNQDSQLYKRRERIYQLYGGSRSISAMTRSLDHSYKFNQVGEILPNVYAL